MTGLVVDGLVAAAAGVAASATMDPVTSLIQRAQSARSREVEARVSHGVADEVVVEKLAGLLGTELTERQQGAARQVMRYGLGVGLAPVYMALRRWVGMSPWGAGLTAGIGLFVLVDEGLNPVLGSTPPPQAYPLVTHVRGLAGHVVLGLALAAGVEAGWALAGRGQGGALRYAPVTSTL
ncbi:hypothetical protein PU560_11980 [Georgenia sp. 10Sc9-8]|uniref:DUF1440 domain-containing protein n=1 Tax=Georgenia halotolerans TaxID=3028317 RepID=A0ABT5TYY5_9MICO|nr:hypothetical protein [Georgenia halotolerans]